VTDLVFTAVKVGFLALLWLFIALVANVIRTDMFPKVAWARTDGASLEPDALPNPKRRGRHQVGQAQLVVVAGAGVGDAIPLTGEITIGRAADCTLDIDDDFASGRHARVYRDAEGWIVADLGSTNGTYINGVRLTGPTRVGEGDLVRIGRTQLKMEG